jgi:aspartyl-tRNA synthetase
MPTRHVGVVTSVHRLLAAAMLRSVGAGRQAANLAATSATAFPPPAARLAASARPLHTTSRALSRGRPTAAAAAAAATTAPPTPAPATAPGEVTRDMVWAGRTADAGTLGPADVGRTVTVAGWVHRARALGGKTFVDVRDATGLLQVVSADEGTGGPGAADAAASLERLRAEFVVQVTGTLRTRKDPNPKMPTGQVELVAEQVRLRAVGDGWVVVGGWRTRP